MTCLFLGGGREVGRGRQQEEKELEGSEMKGRSAREMRKEWRRDGEDGRLTSVITDVHLILLTTPTSHVTSVLRRSRLGISKRIIR